MASACLGGVFLVPCMACLVSEIVRRSQPVLPLARGPDEVHQIARPVLPLARGPDEVHQIARVHYSNFTFSDFYRFREQDRPFIITGVPPTQAVCFGGLGVYDDSMLSGCNDTVLNVMSMTSGLTRKGLAIVKHMALGDFMEELAAENAFSGLGPVFASCEDDYVIRKGCKGLGRHFRFPPYFTGTIITSKTSDAPANDEYGPIFYISQKGNRQTFHMDVPITELWTATCRGRKQYRVVPITEARKVMENFEDYGHEVLQRDEDLPLGMPIWEGDVGPDDIFYAPAGALHATKTLEDTVSVIHNFIDISGLGPLSRTNTEMLMRRYDGRRVGEWLLSGSIVRARVFDTNGVVRDARAVPQGFPPWSDLDTWVV